MTKDLLQAYFERDLSDDEEQALSEQVLHDVAAANRLADLAAGLYAGSGLPQPSAGTGAGAGLAAVPVAKLSVAVALAVALGFGLGWQARQTRPSASAPPAAAPAPEPSPLPAASPAGGKAQVGEALAVVFELKTRRQVVVEAVDARGRRVALLAAGWFGPGKVKIPWDGTDRQGRPLPAGKYRMLIDHGQGILQREFFIKAAGPDAASPGQGLNFEE
jgi:hypothetical protein